MDYKHCLAINYASPHGLIKTYYILTLDELEIFKQWYLDLDYILLDSGIELTQLNLKYNIFSQSDNEFQILREFIETFGTPWELLEQIDELEQLFELDFPKFYNSNSNSDSDLDSELYTQTETIGQIISAHIDGNVTKVKELLDSNNIYKIDDEVIFSIKNKYI